MSDRPEELFAEWTEADVVVRSVAIDGAVALVAGETASGDVCDIIAERHEGQWRYIGGGSSDGFGAEAGFSSWARSDVAPPGVLGAAGRTAARSVVVDYHGERITIAVRDGWFAWVRGGLPSEPLPRVDRT